MLAAAPRDLTHQRPRAALVLVALVLACHAAGALGALVTDAAWYRELTRPGWAPPGWVFGPVWLTLYTMMGVAAWRVWRTPSGPARTRALGWFAAQLALNAAWTPVFFGLRSLGGGLIVIGLLVGAIAGTIRAFRVVSPRAAWLLAPYLAWVLFATALNGALWWLAR
ncbi:MAG: tryptophan-rich sensory protein [Myxococcales bacterium]|nr:tryptophan-rich sensory protein [Myxococcales bacterium]